MAVTISFDPQDSDDVAKILEIIGEEPEVEVAPAPAAAKPKKAKAAPAPEPEEEPEESEEATLQACIDKATELVSEGRAGEVKGALANLGVKRVGELEESQYAAFLEALAEESVV